MNIINKISIVTAGFIICLSCTDGGRPYSSALKELDNAISKSKEIWMKKEMQEDSLRNRLTMTEDPVARFDIYKELFEDFRLNDSDSALFYAHKMDFIARTTGDCGLIEQAAFCMADRYLISGTYYGALEVIDALDTTKFDKSRWHQYWRTKNRIYHGLYLTEKDPMRKQEHRNYEHLYLSKIPDSPDENQQMIVINEASKELEKGQPKTARSILEGYMATNTLSVSDLAGIHYWMAKTYRQEGDDENAIVHYALSARCDILTPVKASRSMVYLSRLLFENGDTGHAFKYILTAYEDATQSDACVALDEINLFLPKVVSTYNDIKARRTRLLTIVLSFAFVFISLLAVLLVGIVRDRRKIEQMQEKIKKNNEEINTINAKLTRRIAQYKESNKIKVVYIGRYMSMILEHIDSLERYRSMLRIKAKSYDMEEIQKALRSTEPIEAERKSMFDDFDATFLGIFPNFVEEINELLTPDCQVGQNLDPGHLNTELRVFALIRLGVNDSASIARFLKKSLSTIYNYRVKLRNGSIVGHDQFEKELMKI